jgi:hypothetical protein
MRGFDSSSIITKQAQPHGAMRAIWDRTMHGTYMLGKPIVGILVGASAATTLPSGATIQIRQHDQAVIVHVMWQQRDFVVYLSDLLDACRVEDVGEITWPDRFGISPAEAE